MKRETKADMPFEAVDRLPQDVRDDKRPFGGIMVVFGGDF
jgi:hypothetical protein